MDPNVDSSLTQKNDQAVDNSINFTRGYLRTEWDGKPQDFYISTYSIFH